MNYRQFRNQVQAFCDTKDFKINKKELIEVPFNGFKVFIQLLKRGASIRGAMRITKELDEMARQTNLTIDQILELIPQFNLIAALIDHNQTTNNLEEAVKAGKWDEIELYISQDEKSNWIKISYKLKNTERLTVVTKEKLYELLDAADV